MQRREWYHPARVYEIKQAHVARAIDILRAAPLTAVQFAVRMWPDRRNPDGGELTRTQRSHAGHAFLRRMGELGYVLRTGDLWTIRPFSVPGSAAPSANGFADPSAAGLPDGLHYAPLNGSTNGLPNGLAHHPPNGLAHGAPDDQSERQRLARLVQQAVDAHPSVTHDVAFGDIKVRGATLDEAIADACAIIVLSGRSANVYPPCGAPAMLVGLQPAEGARALYVRWQQSGAPPELPRLCAWITTEDGIVATSGFWRPAGAPASWVDPEDVRVRIARQRAGAGLA